MAKIKFTEQEEWNVQEAGHTSRKFIAFYTSEEEDKKGNVGVSVTETTVRRRGAMAARGGKGFAGAYPHGRGAIAATPLIPSPDKIMWVDTKDAAIQAASSKIESGGGVIERR